MAAAERTWRACGATSEMDVSRLINACCHARRTRGVELTQLLAGHTTTPRSGPNSGKTVASPKAGWVDALGPR